MSNCQIALTKRSIDTPSGRISYTEAGSGPVALFVHGVVLNKWAHRLADTIPGAKPPVKLKGARILFPEERAEVFNKLLRDHLMAS